MWTRRRQLPAPACRSSQTQLLTLFFFFINTKQQTINSASRDQSPVISPSRMARFPATLAAVLFLLSIFSAVIARSGLPQLALPESDSQSTSAEISFPSSNPQPVRWLELIKVEDDSKTTGLKPDVVSDFPLVNRHWPGRLRHRRGCGHGRRFKPQDRNLEISYGNDMIVSEEKTNRPDDFVISSVEFDPHRHGPRFVSVDKAEFKGPLLHRHDHYDDQEHRIKNVGKFSWDKHTPREFDDEDESHGHGHHHHHKRAPFDRDGEEGWHPHHHHHHPHGQDHGGLMILRRIRKFLDRF